MGEGRNLEQERNGDSGEPEGGGVGGRGQMVTSLLALVMFQPFTSSVEEEEARPMRGGHVLRHVADFQVVDETPEKEQETCGGGDTQHLFSAGGVTLMQRSWCNTHRATGRSTTASTAR